MQTRSNEHSYERTWKPRTHAPAPSQKDPEDYHFKVSSTGSRFSLSVDPGSLKHASTAVIWENTWYKPEPMTHFIICVTCGHVGNIHTQPHSFQHYTHKVSVTQHILPTLPQTHSLWNYNKTHLYTDTDTHTHTKKKTSQRSKLLPCWGRCCTVAGAVTSWSDWMIRCHVEA